QKALARQVANRRHQRNQRRCRKLYGDELRHPILKHLRSDGKSHENAKPFLERGIVFTPAVDSAPHRRSKYRHHQQPERLYPEEIRVAAVACKDKRRRRMKDVFAEPDRDVTHRPQQTQSSKRHEWYENQASANLRRERVQPEVYEAESEGYALHHGSIVASP